MFLLLHDFSKFMLFNDRGDQMYRGFILLLTFLFYTAYHLSRKPISIVKSELHRNCSLVIRPAYLNITDNDTWCDWAPFGNIFWQSLFTSFSIDFLVAEAVAVRNTCLQRESLPVNKHSDTGLLLFSMSFSLHFFWVPGFLFFPNEHGLLLHLTLQVMNGLMQTTGWPAVVACVGNWFGKGKRGFIMGVWNSHTSVGNILGSLIAGVFVSSEWGMSFIVPGLIIAAAGILCFFFLVEKPEDVNCSSPHHHLITRNVVLYDRLQRQSSIIQENGETEPLLQNGNRSINGAVSTETPNIIQEHSEAISFYGALCIPGVVEFSLCLMFAKLVSYTFLYWLPLYISNVAHFQAKEAGDMSTLFDVGGILGGIMAGLVSDFTGGRASTCCVMLIAAAPMLFVYNYIGQKSLGITIGMLLLCGGLVNGPYALITTAVSADLGTHESLRGNSRALSTVTAIIDGTGSIGAALGPLLAGLISPTGWNNVFYMLISADILACLFLTRLVFKEIKGWCGRIP
uniref:Glucose-6-phosphate exchanger SLC37A2 n=2 Tax=Poecilia TaxID=8080 RepID=A0A087XPS8_POEFO